MAKQDVQKKTEAVEMKLILAPRVTEKASVQSSANAYTFVVAPGATKLSIAKEIEKAYKVKPVAVNITNIPGKRKLIRGRIGKTAPTKKAIVFLKKGDTISLA